MTIIVTNVDHPDDDVIATALLNVTIMAADRRGGRRMLNSNDFRSFKAMLAASNGIQPTLEQPSQQQAQPWRPSQQVGQNASSTGYNAVAEAVGQGGTMPPPNVMT